MSTRAETNTDRVYPIDLPTALRLAGAQNLDVQIARERLQEAHANRSAALEQFLPWVSPGIQYHRRDGLAQAVPSGVISDAAFDSYAPGATLTAQASLGDAMYQNLAARQLVRASEAGLAEQRRQSTLQAAQGYFELAKAKALIGVAQEAFRTSDSYRQQLHAAVGAGIAFRGDELRVQTQTERFQAALRRALEQQRLAAAQLALILHLDLKVELIPTEPDLVRITLFGTNTPLDALVQEALQSRPDLRQGEALLAASRANRNGVVYGPLVPTLGAQVFAGGLGGGPDHGPSTFGREDDYLVGLSWRVGPGGLFDFARQDASKARLATAELDQAKRKDAVVLDVVSSLTRIQSLADQIALAERNVQTAAESLRLSSERKQFGVGIVLEDIQAQQDLVQARSEYVAALAEFNKAQYGLAYAIGGSRLVAH